jgi:2-keto-4-pentenoate hydratase/2-oxohepta-3-ene-1,7-dioic acid hydratase in catechol pathway
LRRRRNRDREDILKLLHFDDWKVGVLKGETVIDVTAVLGGAEPRDRMRLLIAEFDRCRPQIDAELARGKGVPLASVRVRAPLPGPRSIACMAVNYMEDGTRKEPAPINAFLKSPSAIIGNGETMVLPDVPATVFEGEAEMAVIIGARASRVPANGAMRHVFGYMNFIDGSARGLLPPGNTFFQMKSRDTFAPIGPYIVTADEIGDPHSLRVRLSVNGTVKQDFSTSDMAHKIPRCIEWVSSIFTLEPGDILATGTNHRGLSAFQDGDLIELETAGLGRLSVKVRDDLKRTWPRDTRLAHKEKGGEGDHAPQVSGKYARALAEGARA